LAVYGHIAARTADSGQRIDQVRADSQGRGARDEVLFHVQRR